MDAESAEAMAISALAFIAGEAELLRRFLAVTGIGPDMIRDAASEPGFMAGVLGFILAHEPTLIAFAGYAGVRPDQVAAAQRVLPHGDDRHDIST